MADSTMPLQDYCASLDNASLPKILQVCSGVYFQGSVYELSGSEVCFSTGDLIKVTALELQSVCCEDVSTNDKFELPINHTGLFRVVADQMPYSTVDEMMRLRPIGLDSSLPFSFKNENKTTIGDFTVGAGVKLTVRSVERFEDGEGFVRCLIVGQQEASGEVCIPLSTGGEFYGCESEECFSLMEIMSSSNLRSQKFFFANTTMHGKPLMLSPLYQVHAIMNMRKNAIRFPSSLEVEVVDVTDICKADFVTPLSLTEILSQSDENFPAVLEIAEGPGTSSMFKCDWFSGLKVCNRLIIHKKGSIHMVLISNLKSRKMQQHFLVSQQYDGRFKRRPREFGSVYEVYAASVNAPGLKVSVTRSCEEIEEEGIPALSVGEQLEIVQCERIELPSTGKDQEKQTVEALRCTRQADEDDDDEEIPKEIYLPMYMQCHFMEMLADNKKYKLKDLGREFSLPMEVKVVTKDPELKTDPLANLNVRIEAALFEPIIQASFLSCPEQCFFILPKWLSMSVYFTKECVPWSDDQRPRFQMETVTEVTDQFLYEIRKQASADVAPPPRPPKRNMSCAKSLKKSKSSKKSICKMNTLSIPSKEFNDLTLNSKKRPPAPPTPEGKEDQLPPVIPRKSPAAATMGKAKPNTYVKMEVSVKREPEDIVDVEDYHDYETVEDFIKDAQENAMFLYK